jgi:endo-1,4-beta-xylanase
MRMRPPWSEGWVLIRVSLNAEFALGQRSLMRRRQLLLLACAAALVACGAHPPQPEGLDALARRRRLRWGSAISVEALQQPDLAALLQRNVGSLIPENALKWDATEPRPGLFRFHQLEPIFAFAQRHNLELRGHTLVWHQQLPSWLADLPAAALAEALDRHIRGVMAHGRGLIRSWDVVNEPIDPQGNGLRRSLWLDRLGSEYIARALRTARQADPQALLLINDYGLEGDDPQTQRKREQLLALIDQLQAKEVPLDGIGLQAHLLAQPGDAPRFASLPTFLRQLRERGLHVEITELDVSDRALPADPALRDREVARTYDAFLAAVLPEPALQRITSWGLSDRDTWLNSAFPRGDRLPQRPLPYDNHLQPKPAHTRITARLNQNAASR